MEGKVPQGRDESVGAWLKMVGNSSGEGEMHGRTEMGMVKGFGS